MNIIDILKAKYPDADFMRGIVLQDDGEGAYIKEWNLPGKLRPSSETLKEWETDLDVLTLVNKAQLDIINAPIYEKLKQLDIDSIRSIRSKDSAKMAVWEAYAQELRDKLVK